MIYTFTGLVFTLKRKEILTHATKWMELEGSMFSETSQTQKDEIVYDSTSMRYLESSSAQRQKVEWRWLGAGEGSTGERPSGGGVSVWGGGQLCRRALERAAQQWECTSASELHTHFKRLEL